MRLQHHDDAIAHVSQHRGFTIDRCWRHMQHRIVKIVPHLPERTFERCCGNMLSSPKGSRRYQPEAIGNLMSGAAQGVESFSNRSRPSHAEYILELRHLQCGFNDCYSPIHILGEYLSN